MAGSRIVLTGPECTGKTTLATALARHLGVPSVPEAARLFAERAVTPLSATTVEPIARLAMELQDAVGAGGPSAFVGDTDLVSTVVYARHYYGHCSDWIVAEARARRADLYLLCAPDLPWTPDGVRDRPLHREALFEDFAAVLRAMDANVVVITGEGQARTDGALRAVESLAR